MCEREKVRESEREFNENKQAKPNRAEISCVSIKTVVQTTLTALAQKQTQYVSVCQ